MSASATISCSPTSPDVQLEGLALIHADDLSKYYADKRNVAAIQHIHADIAEGEITAIIGESGSGKSTLLRLLYGLLEPDGGEVRYRGWKVKGPLEKLIPGHPAMRMVSQHFDDLNTYANVWDNVASRLSNTDLTAKEEKTRNMLDRLSISHLSSQRISDLSGGERQRVAIARALVTDPEVLLMDEPFNQVDAAFRDRLQQDIRKLVDEDGLTVVLVSHDPSEVLAIADALLILREGKVMAAGKPAEIYKNPPNAYAATLLAKSNILSSEGATLLKLNASPGKTAAIHPEWIQAQPDNHGAGVVKAVLFKGFYEELIVEINQISLKIINTQLSGLKAGERVTLQFERFVVF
ncbi:ABC-type Fe3+/spermidine/putrescine transport systems, ATPase components [bacterium A37T11]|nr:ABC-type Fe3+/spermidine/putrescine transport systems, ATPase components [bacterium A37T11]